MSNGYRNGAFALGLVVGGGAVLNLFLWSAYYANKAGQSVSENPENPDYNQDVMWSWTGVNTFINPYDTIAQWGMALLSLAAVYLLWETLKASRMTLNVTRDMARDTQLMTAETVRIGKAQTRAYITIESCQAVLDPATSAFGFSFEIKNSGNSPAQSASLQINFSLIKFGTKGVDGTETIPAKTIAANSTETVGIMFHTEEDVKRFSEYYGIGDVFIKVNPVFTGVDVFGGLIESDRLFGIHTTITGNINGKYLVSLDTIGKDDLKHDYD